MAISHPVSKTMMVEVFCDEEADRQLFKLLQTLSPVLKVISQENVHLYPQQSKARSQKEFQKLIPIFEFDRPDFIFVADGQPFLVLEITEHAYTGDNGLQRFVRSASAAENGIPFIYFGPKARVRDDELDLSSDPSTLSKRNLTSDLFEGMVALERIYGTPQLFVEWKTAKNGKVQKLSSKLQTKVLSELTEELICIIEEFVSNTIGLKAKSNRFSIKTAQAELRKLAGLKNTLASDVRFKIDAKYSLSLVRDPKLILERLPGYFNKGKPDKLIALYCIKKFKMSYVKYAGKLYSDKKSIDQIISKVFSCRHFKNGAMLYYTGYKWRSDPHCGVAINIFYRDCANRNGTFLPLILFYPRISISEVTSSVFTASITESDELANLFKKRYGADSREKLRSVLNSDQLLGTWASSTKQGRIFSKYCSLIICNDGLVIGEKLEKELNVS